MSPIVLVQPPARGRISGGFLYNARMAEGKLWQLVDLPANELRQLEQGLGTPRLVLMDSIWLTPEHAAPFLALQARGVSVGLMLHSFPSMIDATENGRAPLAAPTAFEREVIDRLDVVVVPGRHYVEMLAGSRTRIVTAEPGVEDSWRAPPRRRSGVCRFVSVGAVTPRKGFLDVARALAALRRDDFAWSVAGSLEVDRDYAARVVEQTRGLPASLGGQLPPAAVREMVQRADVFLMPSYDENQPLVLLEAMAASVPAIAYSAGATRHMVQHGRHGLVLAIGDEVGLAESIARLLDDEELRYRFAAACWETQAGLRSWHEAARQVRAELADIVGTSPVLR